MFLIFKIEPNSRIKSKDIAKQSELMFAIKNANTKKEIESAFGNLYDLLYKKLWSSLAMKFIPPLNDEELQDSFQDGWIKVLDKRKTYDTTKNAYNWIFTIIKNQIIDYIRKNTRYNVFSYDEDYEKDDEDRFVLQIKDNSQTPDEVMIDIEQIRIIKEAIDNLDDLLEKQILQKRFYDEMKLEQISKEMDIPLASVHYKLNKALQKIKPKLENIFDINSTK